MNKQDHKNYYTLFIRKTWSERLEEVSKYCKHLGGKVYQINDTFASIEISCNPNIIPQLSQHQSIEFIEKN